MSFQYLLKRKNTMIYYDEKNKMLYIPEKDDRIYRDASEVYEEAFNRGYEEGYNQGVEDKTAECGE